MENRFVNLPGVDIRNAYACLVDPDENWNGWLVPYFPADEALRVARMLMSEDLGGFSYRAFILQERGGSLGGEPVDEDSTLGEGKALALIEDPIDDFATVFEDWPQEIPKRPEDALRAAVSRMNQGHDAFAKSFLEKVTVKPRFIDGEPHYCVGGYEFTWSEVDVDPQV